MSTKCKEWINSKIEHIRGLESYGAEQTNERIAKKFGLQSKDILKLNYNENLFISRCKIASLLKEVAEECDLRIYPQEEEDRLRQKISEYLAVPEEAIALGNSSDEVMDRVTRIFLEKGTRAVTFIPTFSIFGYCVKYCGADLAVVPLREDFTLDLNHMRSVFSTNSRLLYLCSPNNPTANQLELEEIAVLVENFPGIVLVDEAYAEFADFSVIPLINRYENLVILRTFSKAFGIAGLRLGYAIANPNLAQTIDKLPTPYAVNVVSLSMGRKLLENIDLVVKSVAELKTERARLITRLNEVGGVKAFDSKTNFVLFKAASTSDKIYNSLLREGIIIKNLGKLLQHENCLRSTVGIPEMNGRLLKALQESLR